MDILFLLAIFLFIPPYESYDQDFLHDWSHDEELVDQLETDFHDQNDHEWPNDEPDHENLNPWNEDERLQPSFPEKPIKNNENMKNQFFQYNYESQTLISTSGSNDQSSGSIILAKINLMKIGLSGAQCLAQMNDVKFGRLNKQNMAYDKNSKIDNANFEMVAVDAKQLQLLTSPIKFNCEQNDEMVFDGSDQPWSQNIKMAAMNMLQVEDFNEDNGNTVHQNIQEATEGKCNVEISSVKQTDGKNNMKNITKIIDYKNCMEKPELKYNFRSIKSYKDGLKIDTEEPMKRSTIMKQSVSLLPDSKKIIEAETKSQYLLPLSSDHSQHISTFVNTKITLINENSKLTIGEPKNPKRHNQMYSFEWDASFEKFLMTGHDQSLQQTIQNHEFSSPSQKLKLKFDSLLQTSSKYQYSFSSKSSKIDQTSDFLELINLIRLTSADELKKFEEMIGANENRQNFNEMSLYGEILGICASKICVQRLITLITQKRLTQMQTISSLNELRNAPVSSQDIVKEILNLAKSMDQHDNDKKEKYFLKQTIWLLSGSMMNTLCSKDMEKWATKSTNENNLCPTQLKKEFIKTMAEKLHQTQKWNEKIIFTKAIGNSGLPEGVEVLKRQIFSQDSKDFVRSSAIYALQKMAMKYPNLVHNVLQDLIENKNEKQELRITAIHVLSQSNPGITALNKLVDILQREPGTQVAYFIATYLKTLSKTDQTCNDSTHSKSLLMPKTTKKHEKSSCAFQNLKIGRNLELNLESAYRNGSIFSKNWPFHIVLDLNVDWLGIFQQKMLTLGMASMNGAELTKNLADAIWHAAKKIRAPSFDDLWGHNIGSNVPKGERLEDFMKEILEHVTRNKKPSQRNNDQNPKAVIYLQIKDQNVAFFPVSEKLIGDAIEEMLPEIQRIEKEMKNTLQFNVQKLSMLQEILYKIPTSNGMPLSVSFKMPTIFGFNGKILSANNGLGSGHFETQLEASMNTQILSIIDVNVWSPIISHGVRYQNKFDVQIPLSMRINGNIQSKEKSLRFNIQRAEQPKKILSLKSQTFAYALKYSDFVKTLDSTGQDKLINSSSELRFQQCVQEPFTDTKFCLNSKSPSSSQIQNIFAPKSISLISVPEASTKNNRIDMKLSISSQNPSGNQQIDNNDIEITKYKIDTRSGERQALLNIVHFHNSNESFSKFKAIFSKQAPDQKSSLVCFDSEYKPHQNSENAKPQAIFYSSFNWGGQTCQSNNFLRTKIVKLPSSTNQNNQKYMGNAKKSQFKMDVNYQNLPISFRNYTNKIYSALKYRFYDKTDVAQIDVKNPPMKIVVLVNVLDYESLASFIVKMPSENATFENINVPGCILSMLLAPSINSNERQNFKNSKSTFPDHSKYNFDNFEPYPDQDTEVSNKHKQKHDEMPLKHEKGKTCQVNPDSVQTFQTVPYKFDIPSCYTIVTKDCANKNRFIIMTKTDQETKNKFNELLFLSTKNKLQVLIPKNSPKQPKSELQVKVNDQQVKVQNDVETFPVGNKNIRILQSSGIHIDILIQDLAINMQFDDGLLKIEMPGNLISDQCGLCGSEKSSKDNQQKWPDTNKPNYREDLFKKFVVNPEKCKSSKSNPTTQKYRKSDQHYQPDIDVSAVHNSHQNENYDQQDNNYANGHQKYNDYESCNIVKPIMKVDMLEIGNGVCFSINRLPKCPEHTYEEEEVTKPVTYKCFSAQDAEKLKLRAKYLSNELLGNVGNMGTTKIRSIQVPTGCNKF